VLQIVSSKTATKSGKEAAGDKAVKQKRGRFRKPVDESSSKKQLVKKSQTSISGRSSK